MHETAVTPAKVNANVKRKMIINGVNALRHAHDGCSVLTTTVTPGWYSSRSVYPSLTSHNRTTLVVRIPATLLIPPHNSRRAIRPI